MNSLGTPQSAEVLDEREVIPERPFWSSGQDDKTWPSWRTTMQSPGGGEELNAAWNAHEIRSWVVHKGNIDYDKIWSCFNLWILAPGIEPGAPSSEFNY